MGQNLSFAWEGGGGTDAARRLCMKQVGLFSFFFFTLPSEFQYCDMASSQSVDVDSQLSLLLVTQIVIMLVGVVPVAVGYSETKTKGTFGLANACSSFHFVSLWLLNDHFCFWFLMLHFFPSGFIVYIYIVSSKPNDLFQRLISIHVCFKLWSMNH